MTGSSRTQWEKKLEGILFTSFLILQAPSSPAFHQPQHLTTHVIFILLHFDYASNSEKSKQFPAQTVAVQTPAILAHSECKQVQWVNSDLFQPYHWHKSALIHEGRLGQERHLAMVCAIVTRPTLSYILPTPFPPLSYFHTAATLWSCLLKQAE